MSREKRSMGSDLASALDRFDRLDGLAANRATACEIVDKLCAVRESSVSEIFLVPGDRSVVLVHLADDPERWAAKIEYGYIVHRCPLPGAVPSKQDGAWYTKFPENRIRGSNDSGEAEPEHLCPDCYITVPAEGECGLCGWVPDGRP